MLTWEPMWTDSLLEPLLDVTGTAGGALQHWLIFDTEVLSHLTDVRCFVL